MKRPPTPPPPPACPACHCRKVRVLMPAVGLNLSCMQCGQMWTLPANMEMDSSGRVDAEGATFQTGGRLSPRARPGVSRAAPSKPDKAKLARSEAP
jgi:hypothetical protein